MQSLESKRLDLLPEFPPSGVVKPGLLAMDMAPGFRTRRTHSSKDEWALTWCDIKSPRNAQPVYETVFASHKVRPGYCSLNSISSW